jgi:hypothetical protein
MLFFRSGVFLLLVSSLIGLPARAQDLFRPVRYTVMIPERGPVTGYFVLSGEHKFSFLAPTGWRMESNAEERKVSFFKKDLSSQITIQIVPIPMVLPAAPDEQKARWRERVMAAFPEADIKEQFECYAAGKAGKGFDLERNFPKDLKLMTRAAYVPYETGVVEFQLTATPVNFTKNQSVLGALMTSFKIGSRTVATGHK